MIAADAPQNRDVLGEAARIVPATAEAFARAIAEPAPPLAPDLARTAAARFSIDLQIDRMLGLYESLIRPLGLLDSNIRSI